jgi:hypothetical protein
LRETIMWIQENTERDYSQTKCGKSQSWPPTGLKLDGGLECTGIFCSCPAFDVDGGLEHSGPVFTPIRSRSGPVLTVLYDDRCVDDDFRWQPL